MPKMTICRFVSPANIKCHKLASSPNHYCTEHIDHESEYLAKRKKWSDKHTQNYYRNYNKTQRVRNETKLEQDKFYRNKQWKNGLRPAVLERDNYLCQYCAANGRMPHWQDTLGAGVLRYRSRERIKERSSSARH